MLPTITQSVIVAGTTEPGFVGTPIVELNDSYGILLSTGYVSGQHQLQGGNVQIHKT